MSHGIDMFHHIDAYKGFALLNALKIKGIHIKKDHNFTIENHDMFSSH